jgi:hypothetical protein
MLAELERAWAQARVARGLPPPRRVEVLKTGNTPYPHPASPIVLLLFEGGCAVPGAVARVARNAAGDAGIAAEADGLERVRPRLAPELASSVPELWARGRVNGRAFVLASAVPGDPEPHHAWRSEHAARAAPRIAAALDWSARFAAALPAPPIDAETWLGGLEPALAALARTGLDTRVLAALQPRLATAWHHAWPAAACHGDFFPGNVLFGPRDRVAVVDWGTATLRAPVFVDPLAYEASFALQMLHDRGTMDAEALARVHRLAPFAAVRRRLAEAGIDFERGSDARLVGCAGAVLSELRGAPDRAAAAQRWSQVLAFEAEAPR